MASRYIKPNYAVYKRIVILWFFFFHKKIMVKGEERKRKELGRREVAYINE